MPSHGGQFLINSTAPMKNITDNHTNFHWYSTAYCTWYEATIVNSTTFPHIAAWQDTVFLCISLAQRVPRSSKSHCTSTDPPPFPSGAKWINVPHFPCIFTAHSRVSPGVGAAANTQWGSWAFEDPDFPTKGSYKRPIIRPLKYIV